jgi:hypothetical protein
MAFLAPPQRPPCIAVAIADDDGRRRLHSRLRLWSMTAATIVVTAWLCTYGLVAAILALAVAKHVLVAILVMGLGVDSKQGVEVRD